MSSGGTGILQSRFSGCKEEDENGSPLTLIEITDSEVLLPYLLGVRQQTNIISIKGLS